MGFYFIKVDTFRPYSQEIGFVSSSKGAMVQDSIERYEVVLNTLTENARVVFAILIKNQIKGEPGLKAAEWAEKAQSELCVRIRDSFNIQLNEFMDHKLISMKKGGEVYSIPLAKTQLEALLSRIENKKE